MAAFSSHSFCPSRAVTLLEHVLLSLSIGLERGARRFDRGIEILDRVAAFLTNAITELETFDFANRSDVQSAVVRTTLRSTRRRDDATRILILGSLRVRILNDVLGQPM